MEGQASVSKVASVIGLLAFVAAISIGLLGAGGQVSAGAPCS